MDVADLGLEEVTGLDLVTGRGWTRGLDGGDWLSCGEWTWLDEGTGCCWTRGLDVAGLRDMVVTG